MKRRQKKSLLFLNSLPLSLILSLTLFHLLFKGKKMSGHMGAANTTTQNLEVVRVDAERNLLLIKGAVPGSKSGDVIVRPASKA